MKVELFMYLLIISTLITMALTEIIKRLLERTSSPHRSNVVALLSAITASTGVGVIYRIPFGLGFSFEQFNRLVLLVFFSWFFSTLLYDKFIQTVKEHKKYKKEKRNKR